MTAVILSMIALVMVAVLIAIAEVWIVSLFNRPSLRRGKGHRHG